MLQYDSDGYIIEEGYQDGSSCQFTLDNQKNPTRVKDRLGNVTLQTFDTANRLLTRTRWLESDRLGRFCHTGSGHLSVHLRCQWQSAERALAAVLRGSDPMHAPTTPTGPTANCGRSSKPAATAGGPRLTTTYNYNARGLVSDVTTPYADLNNPQNGQRRFVRWLGGDSGKTTFPEGTTEITKYGPATGITAARSSSPRTRNSVTSFTYDYSGRLTQTLVNSHSKMPRPPPSRGHIRWFRTKTVLTYGGASYSGDHPRAKSAGRQYLYDYRHRVIETKRWPEPGRCWWHKTATSTIASSSPRILTAAGKTWLQRQNTHRTDSADSVPRAGL